MYGWWGSRCKCAVYFGSMFPLASLGLSPFLIASFAFGLGAIIGSFLNVLIYRFHTGRSLSGRSHCLSCAHSLSPFELVPIVSYLALRGRCAHCGSFFTARYMLVELLTASLFAAGTLLFTDLLFIFIWWLVCAILVVIVVYDIRHLIIPDELVLALVVVALLQFGYQWYLGKGLWSIGIDVLAAAIGSGFFFMLWWFSKGRWLGFGDVKLAFPLGLLVGAGGVFSMVVVSFWVGAIVSVGILGLATLLRRLRGKLPVHLRLPTLTMKSAVPFAPFLVAGCLWVLLFGIDVLALFRI